MFMELAINAVRPPIDKRLSMAAATAIVDTARNLAVISSILFTGSVRSVSRVPRSFSPAVVSMAGYNAPISMLTIKRKGRI